MDEALQWVFQCCESDLSEYYWKYSFYELLKRIELAVGHASAVQMSVYTSLVEVVAAAFGGGSDKPPAVTEDLSTLSPEAFIARVGQIGTR